MIKSTCEQCRGAFPMNETLRMEDRVLCDACCEQALAQRSPDAPQANLQRQSDPTVCANCRKDAGTVELPLLAGLPVCESCEAFFRNRPFPAWIKVSLIGVLALVAVSLIWNVRFFRAYAALRHFAAYSQEGRVEDAATEVTAAAACVPECEDIRILATCMQGVVLLRQERCGEALEKFLQCRNRMPDAYDVETLILHAEAGAAFEAKDYDAFLTAAQRLEAKFPTDHMCKGGVASAWACKYAVTADEAHREQALSLLQQAQELARDDPAFQEYDERIRYRLETREIITREEFHRRFPSGRQGKEE